MKKEMLQNPLAAGTELAGPLPDAFLPFLCLTAISVVIDQRICIIWPTLNIFRGQTGRDR